MVVLKDSKLQQTNHCLGWGKRRNEFPISANYVVYTSGHFDLFLYPKGRQCSPIGDEM